jgi:ankyrin repeat protein
MDLLSAAAAGDLERVQWLLVNGEASITMRNNGGYSALLLAAQGGHIPIISWLLAYGGSSITERNKVGDSAVLCAARSIRLPTVQWLLENGANVTETDYAGRSVWDPLGWRFTPRDGALTANLVVRDAAAVTALLRVMVLQGATPPDMIPTF